VAVRGARGKARGKPRFPCRLRFAVRRKSYHLEMCKSAGAAEAKGPATKTLLAEKSLSPSAVCGLRKPGMGGSLFLVRVRLAARPSHGVHPWVTGVSRTPRGGIKTSTLALLLLMIIPAAAVLLLGLWYAAIAAWALVLGRMGAVGFDVGELERHRADRR
jgi:hypothetical protein